MATDRMSVHQLAKALGKRPEWVTDELRRDAERAVKHWPFATSKRSDSGRWSYVINFSQFQKWQAGDAIVFDYERLAEMVANKIMEKMGVIQR